MFHRNADEVARDLKVLYFHQHFSTPQGSAGIRSYQMARMLVQCGHEVTMVCGSYGPGHTGLQGAFRRGRRQGVVDGIHVIEFDLAYSNSLGYVRRAVAFLRFAASSIWLALTRRYDVLFATTTPLTAGLPGIAARWLRAKDFVFEVRDLWPELPKSMGVISNPLILGMLGALEWLSYRSARRLVGLSPGIVEGIARRGVPPERIRMIPNGCDIDIFATERPSLRPASVPQEDLLAIFAGTHGLANGLDAILSTAGELKRRGRRDIKLVLVGDGQRKSALQARAERENLDNVIFLDPLPKQELAALMQSADMGMQILANVPAFYYGTSPNKFFDYLAAGLPVLCNYPGWLAELIEECDCGFAVEPDNAGAFADALERAADHREELALMGQRAAGLARARFSRADLAREWVDWVTKR